MLRSRNNLQAIGGFTLVELSMVIAIIAVLAAIIVPTYSVATTSAKKAKTRVMFTQWATALEGFRQEYGYYPVKEVAADGLVKPDGFICELQGHDANGGTTPPVDNTKAINFYSFSQDELAQIKDADGNPQTVPQDAFGNTKIAVLFDTNGDGAVRIGTGGTNVDTQTGSTITAPPEVQNNDVKKELKLGDSVDVHAGVIFYSAGVGQSADDIIKSWE